MKYTPDNITELQPNQVFVYGSNTQGIHGCGAAKLAMKWGAKYGEDKFNGQTYGISTKDHNIQTLPLEEIEKNVDEFIKFAASRPDLEFLVTKIGTGYAGLTVQDIAPMFNKRLTPNIILPLEIENYIIPF